MSVDLSLRVIGALAARYIRVRVRARVRVRVWVRVRVRVRVRVDPKGSSRWRPYSWYESSQAWQ